MAADVHDQDGEGLKVRLAEALKRSGLRGAVEATLALSLPSIRLSAISRPRGPDPAVGARGEVEVPVVPEGVGGVLEAVAASSFHCLGVVDSGAVVAWGHNAHGQLGDGSRLDRDVPVGVVGLSADITAVAVSIFDSLALKADGSVVAWGLGAGLTPQPVEGLDRDVAAIAAGLALMTDGTVLSWGFNNDGQLGDGCALDQYGMPVLQQRGELGPVVGLPLPAVAISNGGSHCLSLLGDGSVWAWGGNHHGQLGRGTIGGRYTAPGRVLGLEERVVAVAAACESSYALGEDGVVFAWGGNSYGQLGDGTTGESTRPERVAGIGGPVRELSSSWQHCLVLRNDGQLVGWGANCLGELGDGTTINRSSPVLVPTSDVCSAQATAVSTGPGTSFAFVTGRGAHGWGQGIRMDKSEVPPGADTDLPLGATKLGGRPDLPMGTEWPVLRDIPLSFVAQIDLGQVAVLDIRSPLPSSGCLSFFSCSDDPDGLDPAGAVLFSPAGSHLSRREFPDTLAIAHRYPAAALHPEIEMTLPTWADPQLDTPSFSREDANKYWELLLARNAPTAHRLLGHPNAVQPSHFQPDLCSGIAAASLDGSDHPADWLLLAQFDSDPAAQMCWNDEGRLYYWITQDDLSAHRFDRAWLIAQSH